MIRKYKYRIKTKGEFLLEFGYTWRNQVSCTFVHQMDFLFGLKLDKKFYDKIDYIFNNDDGIDYFNYINDGVSCNISKDMIKRIDMIPQYEPKKFIY